MGTYNGQPGIYSKGSPYASEEAAAVGLYLWIWFGITTIYLVSSSLARTPSLSTCMNVDLQCCVISGFVQIASLRGSGALFLLIFLLWVTFIMLGCFYYTGNSAFQTAGGAFGIATGFSGYYLGIASFLTPYNSFFTLPVIPFNKKE